MSLFRRPRRRHASVAALCVALSVGLGVPGASAAPPEPAPEAPVVEPVAIPLMTVFGRNYVGYWWDHTDLTVAVRVAPSAPDDFEAVAHEAIATWDAALRSEFGGLITLTDVSGDPSAAAAADIVVHYVPRYGGVSYLGRTLCTKNAKSCNNVIVHSDVPQKFVGDLSPEEFSLLVQHELGHALGVGHTVPIESTDLMGYGWLGTGLDVAISQCDLDVVAAVFEWALNGEEPHPPTTEAVYCA